MSQEELGKRVGLSRFPIIDWEAGRKVPDILTASKMAVLFGVSLDYLLGDGENAYPERKTRYFQELPDGSLVPIEKPAPHCALDELLEEHPDLEVWFRSRNLTEEEKDHIARLLLAEKERWELEENGLAENLSYRLRVASGRSGIDEDGGGGVGGVGRYPDTPPKAS